jgi:hypothetical protein
MAIVDCCDAADRSGNVVQELFGDVNPVVILKFDEMISEIQAQLTTTLAATEVGRMLQVFQAAGIDISYNK